jgi:lipocalin
MEYMIFDTQSLAQGACDAIAQIGQFPLIGVRASDGTPQPEKQKTTAWDIPRQRLDGKWIVARLPLSFREQYAEHEAEFDANFPHVIEEYSNEWFAEVTE